MNPNTSVTKIGYNSIQWFLRYGVHNVFRTHRLTHSRTDRPECSMPPTLVFNDGGGTKQQLMHQTALHNLSDTATTVFNDTIEVKR